MSGKPLAHVPRASQWLGLLLALFLLNLGLTFHNLWPTLWITTRHELSLEFAVLLLLLALYAETFRPPSRRAIAWLAVLFSLLVLGRYAEVTAPALFGRPINLYWDLQHLPAVSAMLARVTPIWLMVLLALGALLLIALLYWLVLRLLEVTRRALYRPVQRRALGVLGAGLLSLYLAGHVTPQFGTLRWFSLPLTATYFKQVRFVTEALAGDTRRLPDQPLVDSDLGRVADADVFLVFVESYGASTFDRTAYAEGLTGARETLAAALRDSGRQAVSAFVESPTFGGASWLAHVSLLTGMEVRDNRVYNLLLTQRRETLVHRFAAAGHRPLALMPGLKNDWPEGSFYAFDTIYDESALDYRGPEFGWWRIPDQYALARFDRLALSGASDRPLFLFFPTISSHMPFRPTPPYQPDWERILGDQPFDPAQTATSLDGRPDWRDLGPAYVGALNYALRSLAGYLQQRAPRDLVLVLLGDHQPVASVSGKGASWEVPVHVISNRQEILDSLLEKGFQPGLTPSRPAAGAMHQLNAMLLQAFDSGVAERAPAG